FNRESSSDRPARSSSYNRDDNRSERPSFNRDSRSERPSFNRESSGDRPARSSSYNRDSKPAFRRDESEERSTFKPNKRTEGREARSEAFKSASTEKSPVFKDIINDENSVEDETRNTFIYGRHPVIEILKSETPVNKVWIAEQTRDTSEIVKYIIDRNIPYKIVNKIKLNHMVGETTNHQGVVAEVAGKEYTEFADLIDLCATKSVFFIILDKVEDPHNLGAIIRTADAAGVDAIIIPKHRAASLTGIVAKTAAGSLDRMKVCRVANLVQVLDELKANNVWSIGVDMDGKDLYTKSNLKGSVALVMGGEGQGLTRLLKDKCDFVVNIPMQSVANSLNVSVATALMIYEVYRQRDFTNPPALDIEPSVSVPTTTMLNAEHHVEIAPLTDSPEI
ncbi:MAG: 23S rRNA (guanosine(2251)-2'-O)-methyltransferase RlmB, partial [Candidatus Sericytochromatia bacterium]|nr:23S rRNA (guanosine(2251)-2'-O)-methyltransferase RlmB [Candidatus Sericytochromatia bacterium]